MTAVVAPTIVADDVKKSRQDIPVQALPAVEQDRPNALADASLAFDVDDHQQKTFRRHRGDVEPVRGDNIEALQVTVKPTVNVSEMATGRSLRNYASAGSKMRLSSQFVSGSSD